MELTLFKGIFVLGRVERGGLFAFYFLFSTFLSCSTFFFFFVNPFSHGYNCCVAFFRFYFISSPIFLTSYFHFSPHLPHSQIYFIIVRGFFSLQLFIVIFCI
jgi:hypothetical protein